MLGGWRIELNETQEAEMPEAAWVLVVEEWSWLGFSYLSLCPFAKGWGWGGGVQDHPLGQPWLHQHRASVNSLHPKEFPFHPS